MTIEDQLNSLIIKIETNTSTTDEIKKDLINIRSLYVQERIEGFIYNYYINWRKYK